MEIRLRFLEHPRKGRARHQAIEIGPQIFVRLGKRNDGVGVEERRRRRAVGQGEVVADRPGLQFHLSFHHAVGLLKLRLCKLRPVRVGLALGTQPVSDDLLHGFVDVEIVEAVAQTRLQRAVRIRGDELRGSWIVLRQILDDDAGFGKRPVSRIVAQHRHLGDGPQLPEGGSRGLVREIDDVRLEGRPVLVKGDEHLLAVRSEGMEKELERHAEGSDDRSMIVK